MTDQTPASRERLRCSCRRLAVTPAGRCGQSDAEHDWQVGRNGISQALDRVAPTGWVFVIRPHSAYASETDRTLVPGYVVTGLAPDGGRGWFSIARATAEQLVLDFERSRSVR